MQTTAQRDTSGARRTGEDAAPSPLLRALSLPKGGGAIRGIGEKFSVNPVTGTGSLTVPNGAKLSRLCDDCDFE